jgi:hypothetical protein
MHVRAYVQANAETCVVLLLLRLTDCTDVYAGDASIFLDSSWSIITRVTADLKKVRKWKIMHGMDQYGVSS